MNTVLWVAQLILALAFLAAGAIKLIRGRDKLLPTMPWVEDFPAGVVTAIGALEVLGGVGVVLPAAIDTAPILVPVAATGLALIMIGAIVTHVGRGETNGTPPPAVLLALALLVAIGRFGPWPL
jgi:hypothetical protein